MPAYAFWIIASALAAVPVNTAPASTSTVRVTMLDGATLEGRFIGVQPAESITIRMANDDRAVPFVQLLAVSWTSASTSRPAGTSTVTAAVSSQPSTAPATDAQATGVTVYLVNGSAIPTRILAGDAEAITLQTALVPRLKLRLPDVAAIRFGDTAQTAARAAFDDALAHRDPSEDTLLILQEGRLTSLRGLVESIDGRGGRFRWKSRTLPIEPQRCYGIVFAAGLTTSATPPRAAIARCTLRDGSTWAGPIRSGDVAGIDIELVAGQVVRLPVPQLREIRFASDRLSYLSDLEPAAYEFTPIAAARWPWRRDRSAANRPIRMGGQTFDRGIGMHSPAVLTYKLDGNFREFAATIGIDEAAAPRGNVIFRVLADDREVYNSGSVTGREAPKRIVVPIDQARTLTLAVDLGDELDVGDQADWADARLIKP